MGKTCLVIFGLILTVSISLAADKPFESDGHFWERAGPLKPVIVLGFIRGYSIGKFSGALEGAGFFYKKVKERFCNEQRSTDCVLIDAWWVQAALEAGKEAAQEKPRRSAGFYANEIDAFYQTFPLCKRKEMFFLFSDLVDVWNGKKSYKEVGDKCLEAPK